ncbi:hypothetical protein ACTQ56_11100, partial [[Clostridium] aminophilum]|uniref:hypothetical protein n=1 Tax=[Clostridium] aminophilum TaxID=1526 RepID=UPI003F9ACD39
RIAASSVGSTGKRSTGPFSETVSPHLLRGRVRKVSSAEESHEPGIKVSSPHSGVVGRFDGKKVHWTFF